MTSYRVLILHITVCLQLIISETLQSTYTPLPNQGNSTFLLTSQNETTANISLSTATSTMASYSETKRDSTQNQTTGKTLTTYTKSIIKSSTDRLLSAIPNTNRELFSRTTEMSQATITLEGTKDITTGNNFLTNSSSVFVTSSKNETLTGKSAKTSVATDETSRFFDQSTPTTTTFRSSTSSEKQTPEKIEPVSTEEFGSSKLSNLKTHQTTPGSESSIKEFGSSKLSTLKMVPTTLGSESSTTSTEQQTPEQIESASTKKFGSRKLSTLKMLLTTSGSKSSFKEFETSQLSTLKTLLTTPGSESSTTSTEQQTVEEIKSSSIKMSLSSQLSTLEKFATQASESSSVATVNNNPLSTELHRSLKTIPLTSSSSLKTDQEKFDTVRSTLPISLNHTNSTVTDSYNASRNFNSNDDSDSSNKAWIAAIVIGVVFVMVVIVLLVKLFCQFRETAEPVVLLSEIPIRTSFIGKRSSPDGFAVPYIGTSESEIQGGSVNIAFTQENGDNDSNRSSPPPYNHKSVFMI